MYRYSVRNRPDAHRAVVDRVVDLLGPVDVREQQDVGAVAQSAPAGPSSRAGACPARPGGAARRDTRRPSPRDGLTITTPVAPSITQQVIGLDDLGDVLEADDRGNLVRARDDRGVRGLAAGVGDQARDRGLVELRGVGRRQVVRDDDRIRRRRERTGRRARANCAARARTRTRRRSCARAGTDLRCSRTRRGCRRRRGAAPTPR